VDELSASDQPWFLQLNFWGPHEPYFAPTEFLDKYKNLAIPEWKNFEGDSLNKPKIHDVKRGDIPNWGAIQPYVQHYFACVEHVDYQIGRLFDYLKEKNLYDDTLIVFCADHGESLGIHEGLCDKAIFMYDETCSIPLFIKQPQQKYQKIDDHFVNTCDIYSTILDYAGGKLADIERDGLSMRPLIEGKPVQWPETVVTECSGIGAILFSQRMIRKGNLKYVFNSGDIDELYDLTTDPYEKVNLIDWDLYEKEKLAMRQALEDWMIQHADNLVFEYQALRMKNK
jgi:arylsulfatase A-like enzyme